MRNTTTRVSNQEYVIVLCLLILGMVTAITMAGNHLYRKGTAELRAMEIEYMMFDYGLVSRPAPVHSLAMELTVARPYFAGQLTALIDNNQHWFKRHQLALELRIRYQDLADFEAGLEGLTPSMHAHICRAYFLKPGCLSGKPEPAARPGLRPEMAAIHWGAAAGNLTALNPSL